MKEKISIIQFMPYFSPHKGGLEIVGEEIGKYWAKKEFGEVINIITNFEQDIFLYDINIKKIIFENTVIGYKKDLCTILIIPSIEIINNFPIYSVWNSKYKIIIKYLKKKVINNNDNILVITHTRFFLTSFIGGLFAKQNKIKWIHIEHGSDYVKLSSKIKSCLSIIYDKILGKWILKKADKILAISEASRKFINEKFVNRKVQIFYRGLNLLKNKIDKKGEIKFIFIGRLVTLKGVSDLLEAYKISGLKNKLIIIGDGEEKKNLEKKSNLHNIKFTGYKNREYIIYYLSTNNCILINPSYQEGLPTTVIEGLLTGCPVIASNVGGTKEISNKDDLILFEAGNIKELVEKLKYSLTNYTTISFKSIKIINNKFDRNKNIENLYNLVK